MGMDFLIYIVFYYTIKEEKSHLPANVPLEEYQHRCTKSNTVDEE